MNLHEYKYKWAFSETQGLRTSDWAYIIHPTCRW